MRAYNENYLNDAKRNLGCMFNYLINDFGMLPDRAAFAFIASGYATLFERGNPSAVSSMTGTELGMNIIKKTYSNPALPIPNNNSVITPEYWAG
jgi:hypothetical protein